MILSSVTVSSGRQIEPSRLNCPTQAELKPNWTADSSSHSGSPENLQLLFLTQRESGNNRTGYWRNFSLPGFVFIYYSHVAHMLLSSTTLCRKTAFQQA